MPRMFPRLAAVVVASLLVPGLASAQDWASSVYSEGGAELRIDERIFTLYAALNELGLEDGPVSRRDPLPKREFDPVRRLVRDAIVMTPELRGKFEAFFDQHPLPLRSYVAYTLSLGDAPAFKPEGKAPAGSESLKGFETLLGEFYGAARVKEIVAKLTDAQREVLKRFRTGVDAPIREIRSALKAKSGDDAPQIVVVINLLDGRGSSHGIYMGDELYLVVGPEAPGSGPIDPLPIARAFARAELQPMAKGKGAALKGSKELVRELQEFYPVGSNVDDWVIENLARTVAIKAVISGDNAGKAMDEEVRNGYVLVRELNRGLAIFAKSNKPLDAFVADFLREIDATKLARP